MSTVWKVTIDAPAPPALSRDIQSRLTAALGATVDVDRDAARFRACLSELAEDPGTARASAAGRLTRAAFTAGIVFMGTLYTVAPADMTSAGQIPALLEKAAGQPARS